MMRTVNISLTQEQTTLVDSFLSRYGFANRSEFFRNLLRLVISRPQIITAADDLILEPPNSKSRNEILRGFAVSGGYTPSFLKDLKAGLKRSSYFKD